MAERALRRRLRTGRRTAPAALVAIVMLAAAVPVDAAESGTARYRYKVTAFDWNATGFLTAARDGADECNAGEDASWTGRATAFPAETTGLGRIGTASLKIGNHGTAGEIQADALGVHTDFTDAEHILVTECNGDGFHPGQMTDSTTTRDRKSVV